MTKGFIYYAAAIVFAETLSVGRFVKKPLSEDIVLKVV